MTLLSKARQINRLLQRTGRQPVNFKEMSEVLCNVIEANTYVISRKGKILGYGLTEVATGEEMEHAILQEGRIPDNYNQQLMQVKETSPNLNENSEYSFTKQLDGIFGHKYTTIVPIVGGGDRLGTLLLTRLNEHLVDDHLILAEYGSTVVGIEILQAKAEKSEEEARNRAVVQMAINSLSYSEMEAVEHIFDELDGKENLLVASRVADKAGITRSVIVNALRKLESAGVIESRSLGMKGTYIKVLNELLLPALEKMREN